MNCQKDNIQLKEYLLNNESAESMDSNNKTK